MVERRLAFAFAVPARTGRGEETLRLGRYVMKRTARYWYEAAVSGGQLRPDQIEELNDAVLAARRRRGASMIGGNHVLEALLRTGMYQRVWPGWPET